MVVIGVDVGSEMERGAEVEIAIEMIGCETVMEGTEMVIGSVVVIRV